MNVHEGERNREDYTYIITLVDYLPFGPLKNKRHQPTKDKKKSLVRKK